MPWTDEVVQVDEMVAFITAKISHLGPEGGKAAAYDLQLVPQPFPRMYVEVYIERIVGNEPNRLQRGSSARNWRLTTRCVGATANEVRNLQAALFAAQHEPIPALGSDGYWAELGSETPRPDDGAYSARDYWIYTT